MTRPISYFLRMILFVLALAGGLLYLEEGMRRAFLANPALNGAIVATLLCGVFLVFRQLLALDREVRWIQAYRRDRTSLGPRDDGPLGELATVLLAQGHSPRLQRSQRQAMLDGIAAGLEDDREAPRFLLNVLILLGLIGTFWGLLQTIAGISGVIGDLSVGEGDMAAVFERLKGGLRAPLAGMAVSFSCSLFGVACSVALGFLELQAGLAQRRFVDELEKWLARISPDEPAAPASSVAMPTLPESNPVFLQALIQQLADNTEQLQRSILTRDSHEGSERASLRSVAEKLSDIADQLRRQQLALSKLSDYEGQLSSGIAALRDVLEANSGNEVMQSHLRNIDMASRELVEGMAVSRSQFMNDIRQELKLLGRMLSARPQASP